MKNKAIISNIRIPVSGGDGDILFEAEKKLKANNISYDKNTLKIHKKSIDARKRENISFVASVICDTECEVCQKDSVSVKETPVYKIERGNEKLYERPVIVGFGPAGIFCALALAENGLRPLVIERGSNIDNRVKAIDEFYLTGKFNQNSNIQFGAGGAGTFSDGKLTTRIGDSRCGYVLEKLNSLGAPDDIMYKAKPHVGTDVLRDVIKNAENKICELGGEIMYDTTVISVSENSVVTNKGEIAAGVVVLATGHSARDTYSMLIDKGFAIEAKPFSVGVRIEHLQSDIDRAMYGDEALKEKLGHAEYQLSHRKGDRGVYTFCMCPGGEVMAATSEEFGVVTNGMSNRARDGKNANSAVAVSVLPSDFGGKVERAIEFQRNLEKAAYTAGGSDYSAPAQLLGDFMNGRKGSIKSKITPTYMGGKVTPFDLNTIMPSFVSEMLKIGFKNFNSSIKGFSSPDSVLTGLETRTSAPLRVLRGDSFSAVGYNNIYPCGEGAGYAGGIMSAAVDGLRVSEAILKRFG